MVDKIKRRIDDYLEFDSNLLFGDDKFKLLRIFGGAVRDSIADLEIHDVDILVGSMSLPITGNILEEQGYKYMNSLNPKDLAAIYQDIHVICEPHTYLKGTKIVQLIRPAVNISDKDRMNQKKAMDYYKEAFISLIKNVDISCCGVSFDGKVLYENQKNSIFHCINKVFTINEYSSMYNSKRNLHRCYKMEQRGWKKIETNAISLEERNLKIDNYLNSESYSSEVDYCIEY